MRGYTRSKYTRGRLVVGCVVGVLLTLATVSICQPGATSESTIRRYVGSSACKECHPMEYGNFIKYARKSHSFRSVQRMQKGLSTQELQECYGCHTTGYGKPGGFTSVEQSPDLKDAGCEVCHGPGKNHVETQDPAMIDRKVTVEVCERCHTQERIRTFRYRPLLHGGAH